MARPTSFKPEYVEQARKLCELGATDVNLADFFNVSINTIANWKSQFPEFLGALKLGKEASDGRVEASLYQRATGYSFDAVKIFMPAGAEKPVYAKYREHVPPDTVACIFWLKNRRSEQWRDIQRIEHGEAGEFDRMSDDDFKAEMAKEAAALGLSRPSRSNGKGNGTAH